MDGNGRWASRHGLPRPVGHQMATRHLVPLLDVCASYGVEAVTLYVFSTENWNRPPEEVAGFLRLMHDALDEFTETLYVKGYRFRWSGSVQNIPEAVLERIRNAQARTRSNTGLVVNVAFNYGGRDEIVRATQRILARQVKAEEIDETVFATCLDTAGLPDMDLVIRTSGEERLSNFCLWQSANAVFYATPILWPDFTVEELQRALDVYASVVKSA